MCPSCRSTDLALTNAHLNCKSCNESYGYKEGKYIFKEYKQEQVGDSLDRIKYWLKQIPGLYATVNYLIGQCYQDGQSHQFINKYIKGKDLLTLNLGSGSTNISDEVLNVDIFNYPNVNIVGEITNLPFRDNSVDAIMNMGVIEHLPNPQKAVSEMYRVLKEDALLFAEIPFMQGFHASPYDFTRYTKEGLKILFKDFEIIDIKVSGGPCSGFAWLLQENLAIILSFGIVPLYRLVYLIALVLTFPIKFLDIFYADHPYASNISSGFSITAKKPSQS